MQYIYIITNTINNKKYIGRTVNPKRRLKGHKSTSNNVNDPLYNKPLYKDIRKFGLDNFEMKVICCCESKKKAEYLEDLYTQILRTQELGYNINSGNKWGQAQMKRMSGEGNPSYGVAKTEEQKKRISESRKGKAMNEDNYKSLKIIRLDTLKIYPSIEEAGRDTGVAPQNIYKVIHGKRHMAGNICWMLKEDYDRTICEDRVDMEVNDRWLD